MQRFYVIFVNIFCGDYRAGQTHTYFKLSLKQLSL